MSQQGKTKLKGLLDFCTCVFHAHSQFCFWPIGFTVTLVVTYSETDSVKFEDASAAYNVRKLHFQANLCELPKTNSSTIVET